MDTVQIRLQIRWHKGYRQDWDNTPDQYAESGFVPWGKSRRLGLLQRGNLKAYIGAQHIDPDLPGWNIVPAPETRFFLTIFVDGNVVALRTFRSMQPLLDLLLQIINTGRTP